MHKTLALKEIDRMDIKTTSKHLLWCLRETKFNYKGTETLQVKGWEMM